MSATQRIDELDRGKLSAAFDSMSLGVVLSDARGGDIYMNSAALKFHGFDSTEGMHTRVEDYAKDWELRHSDGRPMPFEDWPLPRAVRGDHCTGLEVHLRQRHTGYEWYCSYTSAAVCNDAGEITQLVLTLLDISRQKRAESALEALNAELERRVEERTAELRQSRALMENLLKSMPGPYMVLTPELRIVAASDAYLAATMTTRDFLVGKGIFEAFPDNPNDLDADGVSNLRASLNRVLSGRTADTMAIQKYDVRRPDGSWEERYWSPINSPVLGEDGGVAYIIHRVEDVTDFVRRKSDSADAADMHERMEKLEAEIYRNAQAVTAANRQLQEANAELESFSYSVSHDLRAPLRHIHGFGALLAKNTEGLLPEKAQRYLQTILDTSKEMGRLIDDLLAFSRLNRAPMEERTVSLDGIVREVLRGFRAEPEQRNIEWHIPPLPDVHGNESMLRQVFANLLGNAVKYSSTRDPAVIEIGQAGTEDGRLIFFVRDNGVGFDMQFIGKLFGVFQRLHRAEDFEGTGIGLATVRRILTRHGGRIWVEAAVDQGATFYFTLRPASITTADASTGEPA